MEHEVSFQTSLIEWGVAARALEGDISGDRHLVQPFPKGVLIAVVDGLGHGVEAATAAKIAVATMAGLAHEPVIPLVKRCHEALKGTRGVVMSLASLNALDSTLSWVGVGNVEAVVVRADVTAARPREFVVQRGGVVGYQLPPLHSTVIPLQVGDMLIFVTDGVRSGFTEGLALGGQPQQIADRILAEHGKTTDDALVLVARYLGGAS